jgi:hypothetical protein
MISGARSALACPNLPASLTVMSRFAPVNKRSHYTRTPHLYAAPRFL